MTEQNEAIYKLNGIDICAETFGKRSDPAVLLLMGATASMDWWPQEFCASLAARGRFVIRYDQRDTGRSESYPAGAPGYNVEDLADDALALLQGLGLDKACFVGMSLGGFIAQLAALKAPQRVRSLVLMSSEPLSAGDGSIPWVDPKILDYHGAGANLDWSNKAAVVDYKVGGWRLLSGGQRPFEEKIIRTQAERELARAKDPRLASNHGLLQGGEKYFDRLDEIKQPTLIIHGTDDIVLRYANAEALHRQIKASQLITLKGAGHELHSQDWPAMIDGIVKLSVP